MKQFRVTLGLGRMSSHHPKTFQVDAEDSHNAIFKARMLYYETVEAEIGKDAPIWGKMLTVAHIEKVD